MTEQVTDNMTRKKPLFKKVKIVNDSLLGIDIALGKAAVIEHYSGAAIEVTEVIYDTIEEEPTSVLPADQRATLIEALKAAERNGLRQIIESYKSKVADIKPQILWHKDAARGILDSLDGVDLLIKPISQHKHLIDRLNAPLDWSLMRSAACPVLISKSDWTDKRSVIAALDVGDVTHSGLNRLILQNARDLAEILGSELHVMTAYPDLGQSVNELQVAMDYDGIKRDMRETRAGIINELLRELDITVTEVHLLEGRARDEIPHLANQLGATITVLGTAARHGLSQLLIGNTAEAIISALDGDIVTVREPAE